MNWWEYGLDPFGTLAPSNRNSLAEALAKRQMGVRTDGQVVPGGPAGKIGPPSEPQPWSTNWLLNTAVDMTPVGAANALADVAGMASSGTSFGTLAPAAVLAAAGIMPGMRPAAKAGKAAIPEPWTRAKQQNYNTRQDLYHATTGNFDSFDPALQNTGAALPTGIGATWLTSKPSMADSYLARAKRTDEEVRAARAAGDYTRPYAEGANVMPVWVRDMDKFLVDDMRGAMYNPDLVTNVLRMAKERGAPGVIFKNMRDPGEFSAASRAAGMTGKNDPANSGTVVAVFADEKIRSKYAQFDPNRMNERNLTAGIVPVMTAGGLVLLVPEESEAAGR